MKRNKRMIDQLRDNFCNGVDCSVDTYTPGKIDRHTLYAYMEDSFYKLENTVNGLLYFGMLYPDQAEDLLGYCDSYMQGALYNANLL